MGKLTVLLLFLYHESCDSRNPQSRIIGGELASEGGFPFLVSIREISSWRHLCGGSIIDSQWILTAAHCVKVGFVVMRAHDLEIYAGTTIRKHGDGIIHGILQIIVHPNYQAKTLKDDVALIQMILPMKFSPTVTSVGFGWVPDQDNFEVVTAGWGQIQEDNAQLPRYLYSIVLKTMNSKKCQKIHNKANNTVDGSTQICAYGGIGKTLCFGDSGGPLIHRASAKLVGVFSGMQDCSGDFPVLFTRVEAYSSWINYVTELSLVIEYCPYEH